MAVHWTWKDPNLENKPGDIIQSVLAPTYYQNRMNREAYQQSVSDSRQDATTAYNRQLEMWNMTNAYNDPSAQRARLEAAGLSPHFQHGSSGGADAAVPTVAKATSHSAMRMERAQHGLAVLGQFMNILGAVQGINKTAAETEAVRTSSKLNVANAVLADAHAQLYGHQSTKTLQDITFGKDLHPYQVTAMEAGNRLKRINAEKLLEDIMHSKHSRKLDLDKLALDRSIYDLRKAGQAFDHDLRTKQFREGVRQYDTSLEETKSQYDYTHDLKRDQFEEDQLRWRLKNRTDWTIGTSRDVPSSLLRSIQDALHIFTPKLFRR